MLDLKFIRENPDVVREAVRKRRSDLPLDELLDLDRLVMGEQQRLEALQGELNPRSKQVRDTAPEERPALIAENRTLGEQIEALKGELKVHQERLHALLLRVPNIPDESVPEGSGEDDNVPIKHWGTPPHFDFTPLDHVTLMERLDLLDIVRG